MTDKHVSKLVKYLMDMRQGLGILNIRAHVLDEIAVKLQSQADELEAYRATEPYKSGYADGRATAFATGLTGDDD